LKKKRPDQIDVQIHAVEHCNLGCKWCNAFSPIADEKFAKIEEIEADLKRFSELTGSVLRKLIVSGGEPLLHPRLHDIFECARKYFPDCVLEIITNGLLLKNAPDTFWKSCNENDVTISVTRYPIENNTEKIELLAKSHHVKLVYQDDTDIREKTMYFTPLDPSGKQDAASSYRLCYMSNYCFVLENGRLYTCPTVAHIEFINKYFKQDFIVSEHDYADIYQMTNIDDILSRFQKSIPFCRYCVKRHRLSGLNWALSEKDMTECIC